MPHGGLAVYEWQGQRLAAATSLQSVAEAPGDCCLVQPGLDGLLGSPTPMASLQGRAQGLPEPASIQVSEHTGSESTGMS